MIAFGLRASISATGIERDDLGVDVALAHAAGDELRVLRAEVDDEDRIGVRYVRVSGLLRGVGLRHE